MQMLEGFFKTITGCDGEDVTVLSKNDTNMTGESWQYLILCMGNSVRQISYISSCLIKQAKHYTQETGLEFRVAGFGENWCIIQSNSITVHVMTKMLREKHEIEIFWALGPKFDRQVRKFKN
ncbi:hypothetical protein MXB_3078 [Myxobolus squamalis]|nr:hypothetical protein MXB_3078 [Myxobolus squamalis]